MMIKFGEPNKPLWGGNVRAWSDHHSHTSGEKSYLSLGLKCIVKLDDEGVADLHENVSLRLGSKSIPHLECRFLEDFHGIELTLVLTPILLY